MHGIGKPRDGTMGLPTDDTRFYFQSAGHSDVRKGPVKTSCMWLLQRITLANLIMLSMGTNASRISQLAIELLDLRLFSFVSGWCLTSNVT